MNKMKRYAALFFTMVLMVSVFALPASAKNNEDVPFIFNFSWTQSTGNTVEGKKEDDSGTYIKASQIPKDGFQVFVDGKRSDGTWIDCTSYAYGTAFLTVTGAGRLVRQFVYENGYRYARLGGYKTGADKGATGVWSPDSLGSYPYLN